MHVLGTWMFLLPRPSGAGQRWWSVCGPGASRKEDEQFVGWRAMVGAGEALGPGGGCAGGKFLVCRFPEEEQLCVTSCLILSKLFFFSEPPVSFSANGGANFYHG